MEKPVDALEAEKIINEYGAVMEKAARVGGGVAAPEPMLPHSKERIKTAIKTYVASLIMMRKYTDAVRNNLQVGYMTLAQFIPDEEARTVTASQAAMESSLEMTDLDRLREHLARLTGEGSEASLDIQRRINAETARLLEEFKQFETEQLLNLARGY